MKIRFHLTKLRDIDPEYYKYVAGGIVALVLVLLLALAAAFFLTVRGAEQTLVPDLHGMDLATALTTLQEKELYPRLSQRYTEDPKDKGLVLEQSPKPGAIVKAGRRIAITISRGPVIDSVADYAGRTLEDVKLELQNLFSTGRPLMTVREPPIYSFSAEPAGTILEQTPLPGTPVSGAFELVFVVSKGPEREKLRVPDFSGLELGAAFLQIEKSGVSFAFELREPRAGEKPGTVVSQTPAAGSSIPETDVVKLVATSYAARDGMVGGLFSRELPEYPYPVKATLSWVDLEGVRTPIVQVMHRGTLFQAPYLVPEGSLLVLQVLGRDVARVEARP